MRDALPPAQRLQRLPPAPRPLPLLHSLLSRVEKGVRQNNLIFAHLGAQEPLLRLDESPLCELGVESVELVDEALVDLGAFAAGVEILQRLEDVPLIPELCLAYLIMK